MPERNTIIIQSVADADAHDPELPALLLLPGHLARPVAVLLEELFSLTPRGYFARAVELQLVGLAERESCCVLSGIKQAQQAAVELTRPPEEIAVEVAEVSTEDVAPISHTDQTSPRLRLLLGGSGAKSTTQLTDRRA